MGLKNLLSLKIVFFLLGVLTINTTGQICSAPLVVEFYENNTVGASVATITTEAGVSLKLTNNPDNAFGLNGNALVANKVLDYEALPPGGGLSISILCTKDGPLQEHLRVTVIVQNINDIPPVFEKNLYTLEVNELSKVGTTVGRIEAKDSDSAPLYYRLVSPMEEFGLKTETDPEILVKKVLDYDTIKEVTLDLFAQDTPLSATVTPSYTATTTVIVTVLDINNRPPWFQPCTEFTVGIAKGCVTSGYTGNVNLHQQVTGALTLKPGPVYAIDGDKGRNDPIRYDIIEGNEDNTFIMNQNTGAITMRQPVGVAGPIILRVMAYELESPDLATTTVTLQVLPSSKYPPEFVKPKYEGFISEDAGVGSLVLESKSNSIPLQVQATDADFTDGVNPNITFEVPVDSVFKVTPEGFIIMTRAAPPGNVNMQISVVDPTTGEFSTTSLSVEVTPGVTTMATTTVTELTESTSSPHTTTTVTELTESTSSPHTTTTVTELTESTSSPHTTTTVTELTESTSKGMHLPSGDFRTEDMVALGVSLAIALLVCFVVIGFLAYNIRRFSADWKKLSEISIFHSSLSGGSGGPKDGVQYTSEDFQVDGDKDSVNLKQAAELPLPRGPELSHRVPEVLKTQRSSPTMQSKNSNDNPTLPTDSSSQYSLDNTDNEKEVKPILTKERRTDEGYKAVWFKADIDPNDKEEVVISDRDQDIDLDDDDDDDHEDDDHDHSDGDDDDDEEDPNLVHL
ncbi:cadherin-related family member 5 [Neoarius graeffei]|uniref:cadherin-related family member 5 n=1 Tax=Neoarius graeffei TaxID=443677 RepID=UPI00298BE157|nr:cadherin-related family member 5 [Neoarius graeffei]